LYLNEDPHDSEVKKGLRLTLTIKAAVAGEFYSDDTGAQSGDFDYSAKFYVFNSQATPAVRGATSSSGTPTAPSADTGRLKIAPVASSLFQFYFIALNEAINRKDEVALRLDSLLREPIKPVDELLNYLRSDCWWVRAVARHLLMGTESLPLSPLFDALDDNDAEVRITAGWLLGNIAANTENSAELREYVIDRLSRRLAQETHWLVKAVICEALQATGKDLRFYDKEWSPDITARVKDVIIGVTADIKRLGASIAGAVLRSGSALEELTYGSDIELDIYIDGWIDGEGLRRLQTATEKKLRDMGILAVGQHAGIRFKNIAEEPLPDDKVVVIFKDKVLAKAMIHSKGRLHKIPKEKEEEIAVGDEWVDKRTSRNTLFTCWRDKDALSEGERELIMKLQAARVLNILFELPNRIYIKPEEKTQVLETLRAMEEKGLVEVKDGDMVIVRWVTYKRTTSDTYVEIVCSTPATTKEISPVAEAAPTLIPAPITPDAIQRALGADSSLSRILSVFAAGGVFDDLDSLEVTTNASNTQATIADKKLILSITDSSPPLKDVILALIKVLPQLNLKVKLGGEKKSVSISSLWPTRVPQSRSSIFDENIITYLENLKEIASKLVQEDAHNLDTIQAFLSILQQLCDLAGLSETINDSLAESTVEER
ncbi:MAG: HEAT repeat domain-containing protein, partial [Candidatus Omnitrophica bacterium]|nr:HEAT repeat domain-containing protein [Candidatus Omnitrophota bacterium]